MIYHVKYRVANGLSPNYCLTAEFNTVLLKTPLNKEFVDARFSVKVVAISFVLIVIFPEGSRLPACLKQPSGSKTILKAEVDT